MKRFFFNLLTVSLTFLLGVFTQGIFQLRTSLPSNSLIETNKVIQISTVQIENNQVKENERTAKFETVEFGSGWYSVDKFRGMKEVWTILFSRDFEDSNNEKLVWSAMILTYNDDDNFKSVWIKTDNNEPSFKTNKIKGVEYKFEGVFFKDRKLGFEGEPLLRGNLQKFYKGKKVAEIKADFAYYEPTCWH